MKTTRPLRSAGDGITEDIAMLRRAFLYQSAATLATASLPMSDGERFAKAARSQVGVTTGYDPRYVRMAYPGGDVPRSTGVCADVIVRAGREGLGLDLQRLVHEDMEHHFAAYPRTWGMQRPDANIDHRRVLNLEAFWRRSDAMLWHSAGEVAGDAFQSEMRVGDVVTWLLDAKLPHVAIVVATARTETRVVHNIGEGAQEVDLAAFRTHRAQGHYRWPRKTFPS